MDREIKVTKCGEQVDSDLNDRVSIEFTPLELSALKYIFSLRCDETREDPSQRGDGCKMHGVFADARKVWQEARYHKHVEKNP